MSTARRASLVAALAVLGSQAPQQAQAIGETRTITLHHIHTKEDITITFKKDGRYVPEALEKLNRFVRDWRKDQEVRMDPQLYDLMWEVQHEVGHKGAIHIICGYRSPATNAMLRSRSRGVAKTSLHMAGKAMDFTLPGADLAEVRAAALRIQGGGVGYYPTSGVPFVHMDVGNVRHWPRMTEEQMARVMAKGPVKYAAERKSGKSRTLLASLFSSAQDEEETADATPTPAPVRSAARRPAPKAEPATRPEPVVAQAPRAEPVRVAAAEPKPAPLPPVQPIFQIASAESTPVRLSPAAAADPASANSVIAERGYWQGLPELASLDTARRITEPRSANAEATGSVGPMALAYANPADGTPAARAPSAMPEPAKSVKPVAATDRLDNPWMRGVMMAQSMQHAMTATVLGTTDFRALRPFMQKPASSLVMTFAVDPYLGLTTERFTGSAIVFQPTLTYSMRTAALR